MSILNFQPIFLIRLLRSNSYTRTILANKIEIFVLFPNNSEIKLNLPTLFIENVHINKIHNPKVIYVT